MKIKFLSLGSGSSGNCYYLGTEKYGILIDAGIGIRNIKKILKDYRLDFNTIKAVFITHDHADHIKAVGHLGEKHGIPVYATPEIHQGISKSYCVTEKLSSSINNIEKEESIVIGDFKVTAFEVPHDGTDNVGYCIEVDGKVFSFLTDLGEITEIAAKYIKKADYLILEANYDDEMLAMGPYPKHLRDRISSSHGHMSNKDTAIFLADNFPVNLKYLWLCHLSKDNNHPELAYKTVEMYLLDRGIIAGKDFKMVALKRTVPSDLYLL